MASSSGPFAFQDLEGACISKEDLLSRRAGSSPSFDDDGTRRRVSYAALDVEEFGSVYLRACSTFTRGCERTSAASTWSRAVNASRPAPTTRPRELVHALIESALVPVLEEAAGRGPQGREAKREALLALRVCDPAAGSGHFLLAAARRIATVELAREEGGEEAPSPEAYRDALRQVIRHCIYAVDKHALAVDLCKVALWIEGHSPRPAAEFPGPTTSSTATPSSASSTSRS